MTRTQQQALSAHPAAVPRLRVASVNHDIAPKPRRRPATQAGTGGALGPFDAPARPSMPGLPAVDHERCYDPRVGTLGAALAEYPLMITALALGGIGVSLAISAKLAQMVMSARD